MSWTKKLKRKCVKWFLDFIDSWNEDFHNDIENRIHAAHKKLFPKEPPNEEGFNHRLKLLNDSREFYFKRMMATASLIVSLTALLLSFLAVVITLLKV